MLLDSNIIIYASQPEFLTLRDFLSGKVIATSVICKIETLGYSKLEPIQKTFLENFFDSIRVVPLTNEISEKAIRLRQVHAMSLGDSIIAATALIEEMELVTRNISDFKMIKGLKLFNPLKIKN